MTDVAGFLAGLEVYRGKLDRVIDATRDLLSLSPTNGVAPVAAPEPVRQAIAKPGRKALPAPKAKVASPIHPTGENGAKRKAEAYRLWSEGRSVNDIATALGVSAAAVYQWKKAGTWPAQKGKAPDAKGERPTFMCQECRQKGFDPKRCDHCQERR